MSKRKQILGIPIDALDFNSTLKEIEQLINDGQSHQLATVNPEFIIEARKNQKFKKTLLASSLNTPDGRGILWALKLLYNIRLKERVTGVDLFWALCKLSEDKGYRIFMLGGGPGVGQKAKKRVKLIHPRARIVYTYAGSPAKTKTIIKLIRTSRPNILFVAWGTPKQEIWIAKNLKKFHLPLVAMGVGGTFDFVAGTKIRAPRWMQKIGLEWLYRLLREPKRFGRIWTAVVRFPLAVFISKFKKKNNTRQKHS